MLDLLPGLPGVAGVGSAMENVAHKLLYGQLADLRPMPHTLIDEGPSRSVYHYPPSSQQVTAGLPVLLVPPLAAPSLAFDLRRGCSLVEHLVTAGRPVYLVDYGQIAFSDRRLGVEFWVEEVVPRALEAVSDHAGGSPVQVVAWCLGGIFALLVAADRADLPIASVTAVASPFDVTAVPMVAPLRPLIDRTGAGWLLTTAYRTLGGAPAPLVKRAYQATSLDTYVTKPLAILQHLHDREFLAQVEAVDRFMDNMLAYPGRTFGQLYHRFFRANDLAGGYFDLGGRRIELDRIEVPVLAIAGEHDSIAPAGAVRHLTDLLPAAPSVRFETAPSGHLGVLTGRAAWRTTWVVLDEFLAEHDQAARGLR